MNDELSIGEVARLLGLSVKQVRSRADAGAIPCTLSGRRRVFTREAVETVRLQSSARKGAGERDALAVKLLRRGDLADADVVGLSELPLERVASLRRSLGESPTAAIDRETEKIENEARERLQGIRSRREQARARASGGGT